jgi:ABC-type uncharacterized transport system permease subunit
MGGLAFLLLIPLSALWSMGVQDFHERRFQGVAVRTIMLDGFRIMIDQYKTYIQWFPSPFAVLLLVLQALQLMPPLHQDATRA